MAIKLEKMPKPIPTTNWIKSNSQILERNKRRVLICGIMDLILASKPQQKPRVIIKTSKPEKKPAISPCVKKGPRINQLEAPTRRIVAISSLAP